MTTEVESELLASIADMDRETLLLLYVIGCVEGLKKKGFVEGGILKGTYRTIGIWEILEKTGFKVTTEELQWAVAVLQQWQLGGMEP